MPPIQLTRNIRPLLKFVRGQPRTRTVKPMEEPEDVTAPPIDTEEDKSDESHYDDPHYDSTDDEPARGDMNRSVFKPVSVSQKPNTVTGRGRTTLPTQTVGTPQRRSAQSGKKRAVEGIEDTDADEPGVFSSKKRVKATNSTGSPFLGSHMSDGFLVDRKIKPPKAGYGKKAVKTAKALDSSLDSSLDTPPRRKFERVKSMSESVSPQQTKRFYGLNPESEASSPAKSLRGPRVSRASVKEEETSSHSDLDSGNAWSDPPRPRKGQRQEQKQKEKGAKRQPKNAAKSKLRQLPADQLSADEDISQRPAFRMPDGYDDFASTSEVAGIDMPKFPDSTADETAHLDPDEAPCPMCDEPVDKQWLSEYSKGQRMSISRQAKFCHLHKKRSARELWEARGYPEVDWGQLEARIESHRSFLESLINGAASHFGERLWEKIRTGENRTLFTTDDYPIPGYYGLRGMSVMTEGIVGAFSWLLRERAPLDRLISARGHTAYVQAVLVPELGVRLIMEDMGIGGEGEARAVMRESRAVGVILNDERGESRAASQAQAVFGGGDQGDGASEVGSDNVNNKSASGTDGESEEDEKVDFRIQRVDDSDSDLSSLASLGDQRLKAPGKGRVDDSNPAPASLASLGRAQKPNALGKDVVDDSDSDLSSLASLDQL